MSKFNRLWFKNTGGFSNINCRWNKGGKFGEYMYGNYGGCSNSNPNTSTILSGSNNCITTPPTTTTTSSSQVTPAPDNITAKWIKNLSSEPLTEAQN